ncbi:MAG: UDP-3-O-[3-hydroxymyristoyl] N-acetylglucosamine deacetylase [Opitutales bacterium]|nr:UDP-3-O-[3-hydroxymyristoyl] N-acetylglucosamine deacetylase [Opitutales bacterium]
MKEQTLASEASISGKSLHTGNPVNMTIKPADAGTGFLFCRSDLEGKPSVKADVSFVTDLLRQTTIEDGDAVFHTIEHILSALRGCGVDNAIVELDASEPPICDGSARPFVELIQEAGLIEQDREREFIELADSVAVSSGKSSMIALPYDGFKITCTSADDRGLHSQHLSLEIDPETYAEDISKSRTFVVYEDIEELLRQGKVRGGSLDSAIVLKGDKILSKEPLRYVDEMVRHKMLDIIGDLTLLGKPLKAHIVAALPGHRLNAELTKAIRMKQSTQKLVKKEVPPPLPTDAPEVPDLTQVDMDVRKLIEVLPHRYPFIMLDRIVEVSEDCDKLWAIKNVTINEPFFQGHFPGRPVMPGVLQLEAMAQAGGVLLMRKTGSTSTLAFFMSADKVKFRNTVEPGDQLCIEVSLNKIRHNRIGVCSAQCRVGDKVVSSAELMFTLVIPTDEDS